MAIWPVGPPKLINPSFNQNRSASRKVGCRDDFGIHSSECEVKRDGLAGM